jgi:hypothetical protein
MVTDTEARDVVRQLMKRFDQINTQRLGMAYVLAEKDSSEYSRLLEAAEEAVERVIQPLADVQHGPVYAALDDPNADWSKAVLAILDERPIVRIDPR